MQVSATVHACMHAGGDVPDSVDGRPLPLSQHSNGSLPCAYKRAMHKHHAEGKMRSSFTHLHARVEDPTSLMLSDLEAAEEHKQQVLVPLLHRSSRYLADSSSGPQPGPAPRHGAAAASADAGAVEGGMQGEAQADHVVAMPHAMAGAAPARNQ